MEERREMPEEKRWDRYMRNMIDDDNNNKYAKDDGRADPHDGESKTDLSLFCHPLSF
jgi:hypothetical protein